MKRLVRLGSYIDLKPEHRRPMTRLLLNVIRVSISGLPESNFTSPVAPWSSDKHNIFMDLNQYRRGSDIANWWPVLKTLRRPTLRLFCFAHAGASPSWFRSWERYLPTNIEVRCLQLPGHGGRFREPLIDHIEPLIDTLTPAIVDLLDLPYAFFGHSMGALVAFELTRELQRKGRSLPRVLAVSGRNAPDVIDVDPPLHVMPDSELVTELRRINGTDEGIFENADLLSLVLPVIRADIRLCETYAYENKGLLTIPISVFAGMDDGDLTQTGIEAWRNHTTGPYSITMYPGDHFYINSNTAEVVERLVTEFRANCPAS